MSEDIESVLQGSLEKLADEDTGELSKEDALRVSRAIRDTLGMDDCWLNSRKPSVITDFILRNSESLYKNAADRWADSLTDEQVADLLWGDVFQALQPGQYEDIDSLASENYLERNSPLADAIATTIVDAAITKLTAMTDCRLTDGAPALANMWGEICVQMLGEKSLQWDDYVVTINALLLPAVEALDAADKHSLWLETDSGWEWMFDEAQRDADPLAFDTDELVESVLTQLLSTAEKFENPNILSFIAGRAAGS